MLEIHSKQYSLKGSHAREFIQVLSFEHLFEGKDVFYVDMIEVWASNKDETCIVKVFDYSEKLLNEIKLENFGI